MGQNWTDDVYHINKNAGTTLEELEINFLTLKSMFSGTTQPNIGTLYAGHPWFDTSHDLLRIKNNAGTWLGVMYGSSTTPIWMYVNEAPVGWTLKSGAPSDCIISIKGGSQSYNVSGGNTGGSWTQPNATLTVNQIPSHEHYGFANHQASVQDLNQRMSYNPAIADDYMAVNTTWSADGAMEICTGHSYVPSRGKVGPTGGGLSHNHGTTYRPYAAVGIMVHPYTGA